MRTWGGRFSGETDARVADFTRSIEVDAALAADDIAGSIAHVRGLGRAGLLHEDEVETLVDGLAALADDVARRARSTWDPALEDVHMNLEVALTEKVGPAGRAPPHRPLAQRPGRHGPAALDPPVDRRARRRARSTSSGPSSTSPSATGPRSCPARPTSSRPSRSSSPITCWPTSRWPSATGAGSPTRAPA